MRTCLQEGSIFMNTNEAIEAVRDLLNNLISNKKGKLLDDEVLRVSMELDKLINTFMYDKYNSINTI
ncbi:Spo0E like sporulation regulatory protein [Clostridiales bacterium oral taxon 876 str. F0540]|nr:Spo0E like sporulation regulatory protein [Clostridiales bacterium oral taxon 876 str. F0540]